MIESTSYQCDSPDGPVTVRADTMERGSFLRDVWTVESVFLQYVLVNPDGTEERLNRKGDDYFARHGKRHVCTATVDSDQPPEKQ